MQDTIAEYVYRHDVWERILATSQKIRSEATVSIGRAARLFFFTENQLRNWEDKLNIRSTRSPGGQRKYPLTELDKLALIQELLSAGYALGDILSRQDDIKIYLQREEVRKRILAAIQRNSLEAPVSIGVAANLLGVSENQLRDWEKRGLVNPLREETYRRPGQRQYPLTELDKLVVICELLGAGYSLDEIASSLEQLWPSLEEAFSDFFSQAAQQAEFANPILHLRIMEEPLTAQNLAVILSALIELHVKCWLMVSRRFADLTEYIHSHAPHLRVEADLVVSTITHNSPAEIKLNVNTDISPQGVAQALRIGIDAIVHTSLRYQEMELNNQAKASQIKLQEREAEIAHAHQEQTLQLTAQKAELDKREKELELAERQLALDQRLLNIQEQRLEIEKKRVEYALEVADKMVNVLHPNASPEIREVLVQALLPDLLQLGTGKGLELVQPLAQSQGLLPAQSSLETRKNEEDA